jgi:hypothetical protein
MPLADRNVYNGPTRWTHDLALGNFVMGLNGTILIFPKMGSPPASPDVVGKCAIEAFEQHKLLLPDTASHCKPPKPWIGVFAEYREDGILAAADYSVHIVQPERITPEMQKVVYLLDVDADGQPTPIQLPCVEFSVATKALPIINYDGQTLCTTWAVVAFSYEDVRYNEEIHRIRDEQHPIFAALSEVFSSPVGWAVQIG